MHVEDDEGEEEREERELLKCVSLAQKHEVDDYYYRDSNRNRDSQARVAEEKCRRAAAPAVGCL